MALSLALPLFASRSASANPRPLPFTYPYETLPEGEAEIEQYVDATPLRIDDPEKGRLWEPGYKLQTEYEYGITDRLELGLYLQFVNDPGSALQFDGTKQRLRLRLAEGGQWPVDVAFYAEVSELHDELELEQKIILQRRFGDFRLMANLWAEQSFERYGSEIVPSIHPTVGGEYQITPTLHAGVEYWMHADLETESDDPVDRWNGKPHHYVGPAVSFVWDKLWWSTGVYGRLDHTGRAIEPGDQYGHAWVRTVIGLQL